MASGIVELTRNPTGVYLIGRIVWESTSNGTAVNTSTVTATLQLQRNALNTTTGTFKGTFTVGSTSETISWYGSLPSKTWVTVKTITATVSHNSDGAGNCYLYALINGPGATTMEGTYVSGSATVTLDRIPRYASLKSVSDFTDEANPVIIYSNPAGTAVSSLQVCISLDGVAAKTSYKDVPKTGTEYTLSLTEAERNSLRAAAPNSNTLQVYFLLKTILGSGSNVDVQSAKMQIVNADPVVSPAVVDTNSTTKTLTGDPSILVALHSTASVTINATAQKYATIKSKKVEHGTVTLTGDGTLAVTNNPIKITVTDSRGNQTTQNAANTIVPYINPTCVIGNDLPETDGSYKLSVSGVFYNGSIGKTANSLTVQYRYKAAGDSYGSWYTFGSVSKSGNTYSATANITGLDYQTVYTFQVRTIDAIHTSGVIAERAVVSEPVFDWGQNDFNFNVPVTFRGGIANINAIMLTSADDLNDIKTNGWYRWSLSDPPVNAPSDTGTDYMRAMRVWTSNGGECCQECIDMSDSLYTGCMVRRTIYSNTAYPWEWVNPPMAVGVEYRTTERYNRKPVYTKAANVGTLPNTSYKDVHFAYNIDAIVRLDGYAYWNTTQYSDKVPISNLAYFNVKIELYGHAALRFTTGSDRSTYNAHAVLYYTKTTD